MWEWSFAASLLVAYSSSKFSATPLGLIDEFTAP